MLNESAHRDRFTRDHLPPLELWPRFTFPHAYSTRLNAASELLEGAIRQGFGRRPALIGEEGVWSYEALLEKVNRIARVLVEALGLVPGNRVLLRGANTPMMAACWLAVVRAGGVAVATMPLLRARELTHIIEKAKIKFALCEKALERELAAARSTSPSLERVLYFADREASGLEARMASMAPDFAGAATSHDDVALIAFTSGTTGPAKGTLHFHRDLLAICDGFSRSVLKPGPEDVFCGSPPLAFTFGLGGLVLFPLRAGAATLLLPKLGAEGLLAAIERHRASLCFTAPTLYRAMSEHVPRFDLSSLKKCVSAGEALPLAVFEAWRRATGIRIIDGIGATEMLHIFISAQEDAIRPGATGKPIPGYEACILDEEGHVLPANSIGRLAVRGPTGCRYLDNLEQQKKYVRDGWNLTGDAYRMDEDGYFWYVARTDDMIISAGYNISGPEIETVLLDYEAVQECAVVGAPDPERGEIVKAFIVLRPGQVGDEAMVRALQDHVKAVIAPY
ncbi:MAG TPA: AMP-binding protein, partial [Stellaceae bacterium]|nr:AMP-binding protein [Stellaceae bacterium]